MRLKTGVAVAVLMLTAACGFDSGSDEPASSETTDPVAEQELIAAPGAIGPVLAGMTVDEASATGFFEPRVSADNDPCKETNPPIQWKAPNTETLMVFVDKEKDTVTSLGIRDGVETAKGVGVGSTFADVKAAYPDAEVEESEALGSTIFRQDGDKWLGLGFNETPDEMTDDSKVIFMEASKGFKPAVYLSGCS
jgi:hypothetical protein